MTAKLEPTPGYFPTPTSGPRIFFRIISSNAKYASLSSAKPTRLVSAGPSQPRVQSGGSWRMRYR